MARISELYPSKYLSPAHLHGRDVTAVIDRVVVEDLRGGQRKPINRRPASDRPLPHDDGFQGQPRACIRVKPANGAAREEPFDDPIPDLAPPASPDDYGAGEPDDGEAL